MLKAISANPIKAVKMVADEARRAALAPSVTATEIDPGPTVSGNVNG